MLIYLLICMCIYLYAQIYTYLKTATVSAILLKFFHLHLTCINFHVVINVMGKIFASSGTYSISFISFSETMARDVFIPRRFMSS